jgi:hypothetical protein
MRFAGKVPIISSAASGRKCHFHSAEIALARTLLGV